MKEKSQNVSGVSQCMIKKAGVLSRERKSKTKCAQSFDHLILKY